MAEGLVRLLLTLREREMKISYAGDGRDKKIPEEFLLIVYR